MDLSTITVADFKTQFYRDFLYLPVWDVTKLYNAGNRTYYPTTLLFYDCNDNGTTADVPGASTVWSVVTDDIMNYVQDQDITNAFAEAQMNLNQALFDTDADIKLGYLYLTAHYLVNDLRAALAGIAGTGLMPVSARTVGSVQESYSIPEKYLKSTILQFFTTTNYGRKYLSMIEPKLVGNVVAVCGAVLP